MNPFTTTYRVYKRQTEIELVKTSFLESLKVNYVTYIKTALTSDQLANKRSYILMPFMTDYRDYNKEALAQVKAKEGAMAYINQLIAEGYEAIRKLKEYRKDNHQALNHDLLDKHIFRIEKRLKNN